MSGQAVQSFEPEDDQPRRNHRHYPKRPLSLVDAGSASVPTCADLLCAFFGNDYVKRSAMVFGRCYGTMWRISRSHARVPVWMLRQIADNAADPRDTADFIRRETAQFEARLARRLELRKFAGRWAGLFLSGAYDLPISTLPKKPKSRRSKTKKS